MDGNIEAEATAKLTQLEDAASLESVLTLKSLLRYLNLGEFK